MKQKYRKFDRFQSMPQNALALIMGGDNDEEYEIIYIDGEPYRIRINKNGEYISAPERII